MPPLPARGLLHEGSFRVRDVVGELGRLHTVDLQNGAADLLGELFGPLVPVVFNLNLEKEVGSGHMR